MEQPNTVPSRLPMTLGLDLGDRRTSWCLLGDSGVLTRGSVRTDSLDLTETCRRAAARGASRVVMEVSTHSPWVSRLAASVIPDVVVANAHSVGKILEATRKSDRRDAEMLARLGRADVELLRPVQHRGPKAQADLSLLRSRAQLIEARTSLVNHVRGACKAVGASLPDCSTEAFHKAVPSAIPAELKTAHDAVLSVIEQLTVKIRELDREVAGMCKSGYPETALLTQVAGVGPICSLTFVLTVEEPDRIARTRNVGAYFGLVPAKSQSGDRDPELHITKRGNADLRRLLVSSAQYILGPFGPDTDLRRFGKRLEKKGGKAARRRAVVAVARKLSVLLLSLWRSGQEYVPLKNSQADMA